MTTIEMAVDTRFHCQACDTYRRVRVLARGQGATNAFQSAETGKQRAIADAKKLAEQTVLYLACPECGEVSHKGEKLKTRFLFFHLVLPLLLLMPATLVYGWVDGMNGEGMFLLGGISAACALFAGAVTYATRAKPWAGLGDRVEFLPPKPRSD
jgi:hypothetical protein